MNQVIEYWTRQIVKVGLGSLATYTGVAAFADPTFISATVTLVSAVSSLVIPELWASNARKNGRKT